MAEIDNLSIRLDVEDENAIRKLDNFATKIVNLGQAINSLKFNDTDITGFGALTQSINQLNGGNIKTVSTGINSLGKSVSNLTNATQIFQSSGGVQNFSNLSNALTGFQGITFPDFSNLSVFASVMQRLGNDKSKTAIQQLPQLSQGVFSFVQQMNSLNGVSFDSNSLAEMTKAIQRFGNPTMVTAVSTLPFITQELTNLVNTFNQVAFTFDSQPLIQMAQGIGMLGSAATGRAVAILPNLTRELMNLFNELSRAPQIAQSTIQMTNALSNFVQNLRGVGSSSGGRNSDIGNRINSIANGLGVFGSNTNKIIPTMHSFSKMMNKLSYSIGKFYASFWIAIRGFKKLWKDITSSMDYVETYNYFSVALRKIQLEFQNQFKQFGYTDADSYAKSFSKRLKTLTTKMTGFKVGKSGQIIDTGKINLGLDIEQLMNYQARILGVTNSVGLMGEVSIDTAKALSMLSGDLSSLTNTDLNVVMDNLQSGLIGMSRTLYKYGIDTTKAALEQEALANGITKNVASMSQAEKMQLRLLAILHQSKVAWGDQANTINSVANQYRILQQQMANLARTIGSLFLPVVQKVLPIINGLVIAIRRLLTLLGFKIWGKNWLSDLQDGISGGIGADIEGLGDDLDDAAGSAKKLKNALGGYDELNILDRGNDSGNDNGLGSGIDLSGAIADALEEYESVWDKAMRDVQNKAEKYADMIYDALRKGKFYTIGKFLGDTLSKALDSINWNNVYNAAKHFGSGFAEFLNGLITPKTFSSVATTIANSINTALQSLNSFADKANWKQYGNSISSGINSFFSKLDVKLGAKVVNNFAKGIFDMIYTALDKVDWIKIGNKIGKLLAGIDWLKIISNTTKVISKALGGIGTAWTSAFTNAPLETVIASLGIIVPFLSSKIPSALRGIADISYGLKGLLGESKAIAISEKLLSVLPKIASTLGVIGTTFMEFSTISTTMEQIANGTEGIASGFVKIGIEATAASTILTALLGVPAGLIVGGITAAIASLKGLHDGYVEIFTDMMQHSLGDLLKSSDGVPIDTIFSNMEQSFIDLGNSFGDFSEQSENLEIAKKHSEETAEKIELIKFALDNNSESAQERIPELISLFNQLKDDSNSIFNEEYDIILKGISGAFADAYLEAGGTVEGLIGYMDRVKEAYSTEVEQITKRINELGDVYTKQGFLNAEQANELRELIERYAELSGSTDEVKNATENLGNVASGINLGAIIDENGMVNIDLFNDKLKDVYAAFEDYNRISEESGNLQKEVAENYLKFGDALGENGKDMELYVSTIETTMGNGRNNAIGIIQEFSDDLQKSLLEDVPGIVEKARDDYKVFASEHPIMAMFESEESYIRKYLEEYKQNTVDPLTKGISEQFGEIGVKVTPVASQALDDILSVAFGSGSDLSKYEGMYADQIIEYINKEYGTVSKNVDTQAEDIGKNFVEGAKRGITLNQDGLFKQSKEVADTTIKEFKNGLDEHSPSKKTEESGQNFILGFIQGIDKTKDQLFTGIQNLSLEISKNFDRNNWYFPGVEQGLYDTFNYAINSVERLWNNFANRMNNISFSGSYYQDDWGFEGWMNVQSFKQGGFPNGENGIFFANSSEMVGKFANGKTAVANNEQIEAGIERAVVRGMMEVLMSNSGNEQKESETHIHVHFGSEEIGVASYKGLRDAGMANLIPRII